MVANIGAQPVMCFMSHLISGYKDYKSKIDFFPGCYLNSRGLFEQAIDKKILNVYEYLESNSEDEEDQDPYMGDDELLYIKEETVNHGHWSRKHLDKNGIRKC